MVVWEGARRGGVRGSVAGWRGPLARPPHCLCLRLRVRICEGVCSPGRGEEMQSVRVYSTLRYVSESRG